VLRAVLILVAAVSPVPEAAEKPPPNLVVNGDFEQGTGTPKGWDRPDGVGVRWAKGFGTDGSRGICIEMDRKTATSYGQGYFSKPIPVATDTEYRIGVDVKSDAPNAIVFVKGFAKVQGRYRETYSHHKEVHFDRYLKPYISKGKFVTQKFSFHPRHGKYKVDYVKVWLYGYLRAGKLYFDNVRIEKVGKAKEPKPEPSKKTPLRPKPPDPEGDSSPPIYGAKYEVRSAKCEV